MLTAPRSLRFAIGADAIPGLKQIAIGKALSDTNVTVYCGTLPCKSP